MLKYFAFAVSTLPDSNKAPTFPHLNRTSGARDFLSLTQSNSSGMDSSFCEILLSSHKYSHTTHKYSAFLSSNSSYFVDFTSPDADGASHADGPSHVGGPSHAGESPGPTEAEDTGMDGTYYKIYSQILTHNTQV
jgi:hypothetical protein